MVYTYAGDFESPASVYVSGIIIRSSLIRGRLKYDAVEKTRTHNRQAHNLKVVGSNKRCSG